MAEVGAQTTRLAQQTGGSGDGDGDGGLGGGAIAAIVLLLLLLLCAGLCAAYYLFVLKPRRDADRMVTQLVSERRAQRKKESRSNDPHAYDDADDGAYSAVDANGSTASGSAYVAACMPHPWRTRVARPAPRPASHRATCHM